MNEQAALWFESHFLRLPGMPEDRDLQQVIRRLVRSAVNQHACLSLVDQPEALLNRLGTSAAVGKPGESTPIVLSGKRLYLSRFYYHEQMVAEDICAMNTPAVVANPDQLPASLDREFGESAGNSQKLAALLALTRRLAIITGGPGTGKTSTVVRVLKILLSDNPDLVIRLAAPTGKAAMRLSESIRAQSTAIASEVMTVHRLLGMHRDGRRFRHHADNPIAADVVIIDEASMIDLVMMQRLLAALPAGCRLIMLGDPQQLPSVDTGNVLADLCAGDNGYSSEFAAFAGPITGPVTVTETPNRLTDAICELKESYRFRRDSAIGQLAAAILAADARIENTEDGSVGLTEAQRGEELLGYWQRFTDLLASDQPGARALHDAFDACRILCSQRAGVTGVESINSEIERQLELRGLKQPGSAYYKGRPLLITENDYNVGLYNGDIGICVPGDDGSYQAVFADGRALLVSRLPAHETCFAMTVHKSQGSEFDHVILALGEETATEAENLVTRELVYTAVTRARFRFTAWTTPQRWQQAVSRRSARVSGMVDFLTLTSVV